MENMHLCLSYFSFKVKKNCIMVEKNHFSSFNRFCVHLLQHPRDWFPACLLPPNQRTTTRQPDLAHLATLVSLLLTLVHLRIIFLRFLSTKPNPQLTMNMPCDIRGWKQNLAQLLQFQRVSFLKGLLVPYLYLEESLCLSLVIAYVIVIHVSVIV